MEGFEVRGVAVRGPEVKAVEEGGLQSEVSDSICGIMVLHGNILYIVSSLMTCFNTYNACQQCSS